MKRKITIFLIIATVITFYAVSQEENLIKPKTKKTYVSEQQNIELDGDIIMYGTHMSGVLIELSRALYLVIKGAVTRVNDYACGEKSCLDKVERTDFYAKKMKIKEKIEKCIEQLEKMLLSFNELAAALEE